MGEDLRDGRPYGVTTTIVIPARWASSRFPGKPLAPLNGKPSILWTWEAGCAVGADQVVVATDDARIRDIVETAGGSVVMTSEAARNGTERCAEASAALSASDHDVIVNLPGDAPLTPPHLITALLAEMAADATVDATTPVLRRQSERYARF